MADDSSWWDWAGDAWDTVSGWFDSDSGSSSNSKSEDSGSWLDRNWDTIGKVATAGKNIYDAWDANDARGDSRSEIFNVLGRMAADDDAYAKQMYDYRNQQAGARAAAARANDAARRKAAKKALKIQKKYLKQMIAQYQPYADAAKFLTPKMSQNYGQYLDTTSLLNQYLTPKVMQNMGQPAQPAWANGEDLSFIKKK